MREWYPFVEIDLGSINIVQEVHVRAQLCSPVVVRPMALFSWQVWNREDSPVDSAYPDDYYTSRLFPFWILISQEPFSMGAGKIGYEATLLA